MTISIRVPAPSNETWRQGLQLNSNHDSLSPLAQSQGPARRPMRSQERRCGGIPHLPFFSGVFEGEAGEFGGFFGGKLEGGGGAGARVNHLCQSSAPAGEFGDDGGDVAGVAG